MEKNREKIEKKVCCLGVKIWDSRHFQQSKCTLFHEESESEVKHSQFLEPEGKNQENRTEESPYVPY